MPCVTTALRASCFAPRAYVRLDPAVSPGLDSGAASSDGGSTRALDTSLEPERPTRLGHAR